jgi:hypothetical protein
VKLFHTNILRHLLVWALHHGEWPSSDLEHRNGDTIDDRIENLRSATESRDHANVAAKTTNRSGHKDISWDSFTGRWRADITVGVERIYLGRYDSREEADAVYHRAAGTFFGDGED